MTKRYKLRIPDGYKVESDNRTTLNGQDAILVLLAPVFAPKPGDYVATKDGQVGVMTKNGTWMFHTNLYPFDRYANDVQKDEFDKMLQNEGIWYNPDTQLVESIFKDIDILTAEEGNEKWIIIFKSVSIKPILFGKPYYDYYAMLVVSDNKIYLNGQCLAYGFHPATETEKQQLIDALDKERKRWDATTKKIIDLPKPGDLCIFWDSIKSNAIVRLFKEYNKNNHPIDNIGTAWEQCTFFESKEQFQNFIKSE